MLDGSSKRQKSEPPSSSDADQVKKLCIICCGPVVDDCEIFIVDLESDIKDRGRDIKITAYGADSDDEVHDDQISNVEGDDDAVVLTPMAKLNYELVGIHTFSVLGSTLYMFEDGLVCYGDNLSIVTNFERKSAYAYDFSSSPSSSATALVKLDWSNVRKIRDMWGPKVDPRAAATPDGKRIVVYSSMIHYDLPGSVSPHNKRIDFEIYHADRDQWEILPGIAADITAKKHGHPALISTYIIVAFNFVTNSVMLVHMRCYLFFLDLDCPQQGWQILDQYSHFSDFICGEDPCFLIGDKMCVSPLGIYDIADKQFFKLPHPAYGDTYIANSSAHIALLDHNSKDGECKFCRVHMGLNTDTHLPHLAIDVYTFNPDKYIKGKEDKNENGKRFSVLNMCLVKSSKFVPGHWQREMFFGCDVFPIVAGIDMSSTSRIARQL